MGKALIVFATRSGGTKKLAELIAEGLRIAGHEAELKKVTDIKKTNDLNGYDAYVFGSATYHGKMINLMERMLFLAEKADLEGKPGGAFGSYGWSGEAPDRIYSTMENIFKMNMTGGSLKVKPAYVMNPDGIKAAQEYGKNIAKKIS